MADSVAKQATVATSASRSRTHPRDHAAAAGSALSSVAVLASSNGNRAVSGLLSGGHPLPPELREEMESRFGADFSDVRIHDDSPAHASAANLHAKAFTHGHDIVFSANRFAPHAGPGKRLLAHELAHVVQQRRGGAAPVLDANAPHEQAADAAGNAVARGQGNVSVGGATGVGVARDEEEGWSAKLKRKYRETKEKIPPEYREKMQKAADYAADKAVDAVALPFGPAAMYAADGLGSSLLHGAQKTAAGEEGAADDLKNFGRDKVQESLGAAKGVATQVTEMVDTAMWVGNEYKDLRDKAAEKIGGEKGTVGNTIVKHAFNATARAIPGMQALPDLADASEEAKKVGLVDPDTGQASITAPMSGKLNQWAKAAEDKLGARPRDPEMFTPMEKAEIASSIGVQVALSATGAEEVKIAMNVVGALSGVRAIVETIRHDKDWKTSPRFWGHIIGLGLSIVGLKHSMAASKITTLVLRYGGVAAAVLPLAQMAADYYKLESQPELPEDERKKLEASIKQDWIAAIHIVKEAILHVAQSQGGKPKGAGATDEPPAGTTASKGAGSTDEGAGTPPTAKVVGGDQAAGQAPPPAKAATSAPVNPEVASATTAKPVATSAAAKPPVDTTAHPDAPIPITSGKGKPKSAASKSLAENVAKLPPEKAGTVTKLPVRKAGETPPSEPVQQKVPVVAEVADKIAVGQTHGADGGGAPRGKPKLSVVGGRGEPTVAALKPSGGKVSTGTASGGGVTTVTPRSAPAKGGGVGMAKAGTRSRPAPATKGKAAKPARPSSSQPASAPKRAGRTPDDALGDFKKMLSDEFGAKGDLTSDKLIQLYRHGNRATVVKYVRQSLMKQAQSLLGAANAGPKVLELGDFKLELKPDQSIKKQVDAFVKKLEGAHSMPQAFGKKLPGDAVRDLPRGKYNPDDALVHFTDKPVHTDMDQPWKDAFNNLRKSGATETTGGKVFEMVADGIRKTPGMSDGEKASRIARLHDEMFTEMKLDPNRSYSVPRVYTWLEILGFKSKGK